MPVGWADGKLGTTTAAATMPTTHPNKSANFSLDEFLLSFGEFVAHAEHEQRPPAAAGYTVSNTCGVLIANGVPGAWEPASARTYPAYDLWCTPLFGGEQVFSASESSTGPSSTTSTSGTSPSSKHAAESTTFKPYQLWGDPETASFSFYGEPTMVGGHPVCRPTTMSPMAAEEAVAPVFSLFSVQKEMTPDAVADVSDSSLPPFDIWGTPYVGDINPTLRGYNAVRGDGGATRRTHCAPPVAEDSHCDECNRYFGRTRRSKSRPIPSSTHLTDSGAFSNYNSPAYAARYARAMEMKMMKQRSNVQLWKSPSTSGRDSLDDSPSTTTFKPIEPAIRVVRDRTPTIWRSADGTLVCDDRRMHAYDPFATDGQPRSFYFAPKFYLSDTDKSCQTETSTYGYRLRMDRKEDIWPETFMREMTPEPPPPPPRQPVVSKRDHMPTLCNFEDIFSFLERPVLDDRVIETFCSKLNLGKDELMPFDSDVNQTRMHLNDNIFTEVPVGNC